MLDMLDMEKRARRYATASRVKPEKTYQVRDEVLTESEICRRAGITKLGLKGRLRLEWNMDDLDKQKTTGSQPVFLNVRGETLSKQQILKRMGMTDKSFYDRLNSDWPADMIDMPRPPKNRHFSPEFAAWLAEYVVWANSNKGDEGE